LHMTQTARERHDQGDLQVTTLLFLALCTHVATK
jgi:hypothetical protein